MRFNPVTYLNLGAGSVEIEVSKPVTMLAPSQVWLRAVNYTGLATFEESGTVYDGSFHEYYHEWTIVGEPLSDWTKPTNLISAYNNPNKAYGREVAFLLPTAGDYTIQLVVTDRLGAQAVATTTTITVGDPLSHYNTSRRIYVDPDGDFTGVPTSDGSGAPKQATTIDSLMVELDKFTWNVNPPMVLFRGGKTHSWATKSPGVDADRGWMKIERQFPAQYWTSFGTGRATLAPTTAVVRDWSKCMIEVWGQPVEDFLTFTKLDFVSTWDPTTERGSRGANAAIGFDANGQLIDCFATMHDLNFTGWDIAVNLGEKGISDNNRGVIADCSVTDWKNYGCFGGGRGQGGGVATWRYAYIGNKIVQNVDALSGGDKDDALANHHGPIRVAGGLYAYIAQNDLFSRNGWSPPDDPGDQSPTDCQPCLRLMVTPEAEQSAHVERNVMEGGYQIINIEDANGAFANPAQPMNAVIENNLMVGTSQSWGQAIGIWRSGITARNNVFILPNVPSQNNKNAVFRMEGEASHNSADNPSNPIVLHSNTYLNLKSEPNAGGAAWPLTSNKDSYFTNITEENNIIHRPSMTNTAIASAPIDTSTAISGFTPRFKGTRWNYEVYYHTLASDVADDASFTLPYSAFQKRLTSGVLVDGGGDTNQAYWTAISGTDIRHTMYIPLAAGDRFLSADEADNFDVVFEATVVRFTNRSGFSWTSGAIVRISLDRTSLIPTFDAGTASPASVPLPRPQTGSAAIGAATSGRATPKDALIVTRPVPRNSGALNTA